MNYFGANNVPVLSSSATVPSNAILSNHPAVIVEAYKAAHDIPNAVLIRLYESHGGAASATISLGFNVTKVNECNGLEELGPEIPHTGNTFEASFTPYKIRSFIAYFA